MPERVVFAFVCLVGVFFLSTLNSSFRRLRTMKAQAAVKQTGYSFFYPFFQNIFFKKRSFEALIFAMACSRHVLHFLFAATAIIVLSEYNESLLSTESALWVCVLIVVSLFFGDFLPWLWAAYYPKAALRASVFVSSLYLMACFPLSFLFLKISQLFSRELYADQIHEPIVHVKEKIIEFIQDSDQKKRLDAKDMQIIHSLLTFHDRLAREVMIPRVDVFALPCSVGVKEAAEKIRQEGYSRVLVYKDNIDQVVGILMYKDLLDVYMDILEKDDESLFKMPIENLVKPVIFTPESKKISDLLQDIRVKQRHLVVVVDEYGGTAGIVTMEDILEELVGDISDEYDKDEESLFEERPDGSWVVDGRMSIIDIEEKLNLVIPSEGDYDSIGGFVFHRVGSIPDKGLVIHHDNFELEILAVSDRSVEKIAIRRINS